MAIAADLYNKISK